MIAWLIIKRGLFYRPHRRGYTAYLEDAGRYTREEAEAEANIEPRIMGAMPFPETAIPGKFPWRTT